MLIYASFDMYAMYLRGAIYLILNFQSLHWVLVAEEVYDRLKDEIDMA